MALGSLLIWPVAIVRGRYRDRRARWPHITIRLALLLYVVAWALGLWMVFVWWPEVALSSLAALCGAAIVSAAGWSAVLLTLVAVFHTISAVREPRSAWAGMREMFLLLLLVVLAVLSIYWHIAGVTLAL